MAIRRGVCVVVSRCVVLVFFNRIVTFRRCHPERSASKSKKIIMINGAKSKDPEGVYATAVQKGVLTTHKFCHHDVSVQRRAVPSEPRRRFSRFLHLRRRSEE